MDILVTKYVSVWSLRIREQTGKLRTYKHFKYDYFTEFYVSIFLPGMHRSVFSKCRCGVAPLKVKTGRYERLPLEERTCPVCKGILIVDEFHVLRKCPLNEYLR